MRIFFIGTVEFSHAVLSKLIAMQANVIGVASKKQSRFNADFADLSQLAEANHIPVFYPENINDDAFFEVVSSLQPDVIYCFGWSGLIKEKLLGLAPLGVVGFHPAKLPKNRGRHPIIWSLALGLNKTASTFFFMDEGADSGPILSQVEIDITYFDDARSLYDKITRVALVQVETFTEKLADGSFDKREQNHCEANVWRKRNASDGKIDFRMTSRAVYNLVRALARPYVGAHIEAGGHEVKVWKVEEVVSEQENIEPGKVLESNDFSLIVKTSDGAIKLIEHEFSSPPRKGDYL